MSRLRLLIVEDEFIVAYELARLVESMGHEVCRMVSSGEEALKVLRADGLDCVLMDVTLRGHDSGLTTAATIRSEIGTPIVFLTGLPMRDVEQEARDLAPVAILSKPIAPGDLRTALEAVARATIAGVRPAGPERNRLGRALRDD